jgi:TetR/AcrR family transcriptional regulator, copper-responsive repressor
MQGQSTIQTSIAPRPTGPLLRVLNRSVYNTCLKQPIPHPNMGRPKKFSRDDVLQKALPVFWKTGFVGTSLQQLETASGVNKSGLYAEFSDKEEIFFQTLSYYYRSRGGDRILRAQPQGYANIEKFLRLGEVEHSQCYGCFSVNTIREMGTLSERVRRLVSDNHSRLVPLLVENIEKESPRLPATSIAEVVMVFFSGHCIEQNLPPVTDRDPVASFMAMLRLL